MLPSAVLHLCVTARNLNPTDNAVTLSSSSVPQCLRKGLKSSKKDLPYLRLFNTLTNNGAVLNINL